MVPNETSVVARDLELFLSGRGRNAEGVHSPTVLKGVAPFAVLLHRRVTMLSSVLVPAAGRIAGPPPHALLLPRLGQSAAAVGEYALAELLDWAAVAWTGRTSLRYFYAGRALPEPVRQPLQEALERDNAVMRRITGSLVLRDRAEHLRAEANRLAAVDHTFTRPLFVKPVEAVLHDVSRGVIDDHGLLEHPAEMLISRANTDRHGNLPPVPPNGKRWPLLVKATTEVCTLVRELLEVANEYSWDGPDVPAPPLDDLAPDLVPVVEALLFASPDLEARRTDSDDDWVTGIVTEALSLAAPEHRHVIALCAQGAGVPADTIRPALEPIYKIRARAEALFKALAQDPDGQGEDLRSLILQALDRGDLPEAREGLDMLEEYASRTAVEVRVAAVQEAIARVEEVEAKEAVRLHLSTVELHLDRGDLKAAATYVGEAERALPSAPRTVENGPPEGAAVRTLVPQQGADVPVGALAPLGTVDTQSPGLEGAYDEGLLARIMAALRAPDHEAPDRRQLEEDVRRLGRTGLLDDVVSTARDLLHVAPDLAVALTEAALERARPVLRPVLWQLQLDALRVLGEAERAEQVFRLGHPPVPPEGAVTAEPVVGAHLLKPRVRPFQRVGDPAETDLPETGPRPPAEEAQLYARSLEVGNSSALGFAVGWAVSAGRPTDALRLYRRFGPHQYVNATAAWNVAVAYAQVGQARPALESLVVFKAVLSGRMEPLQRRGMEEFEYLHGARQAPPQAVPVVPAQASAAPHPEEEAKRLHASGRVVEAAAGLDRLLSENPRSPGAFLLLRIHREQNDLDAARRTVDRIEAAGAVTWRHHLELARNALDAGDLTLAGQRLDRAQELGATVGWTAPLVTRLRRASAEPGQAQNTAFVPVGQARLLSGIDDPGTWRSHLSAQLDTAGLQAVLESAEWASRREPAAVGVLTSQLRAKRIPVPDRETLERLIDLVNRHRDSFLNRNLALWLINSGDHRSAVRVLQDAVAWTPPDRLPRVVFLRDEAVRRGGLSVEAFDPPSPPSGVTSAKRNPDPAFVPDVHLQEIAGLEAGNPFILEAQRLPPDSDPSVVADAWVRAVRKGQSLALGNALGTLVRADRAEEAITLYDSVSTVYWLGAAAAWNLGCVYAASGHLEEAATAFTYYARVSPRQYTETQLRALTTLFSSLGRPVPTPAGSKPPPVRGGSVPPGAADPLPGTESRTAGDSPEGLAARRIAEFRSAPDNHKFYIAGTAVRRAMQAGPQGNVTRYVATMRNLFSVLANPSPKAAAEMAAVLETAGHQQEAWDLLVTWIDHTRAETALLAPAVRISRELERGRQLRDLLERHHQPYSKYELHLSLAKLAQRQNDTPALIRYADLALRRNATSVEAAVLRESVGDRRQAPPPDNRKILGKVKDPQVSEAEAVQLLVHEYGAEVNALQSKALTWFQPEVDWGQLAQGLSDELQDEARPALEAAAAEDWERAATLFSELLLGKAPRNIVLVRATVVCLLKREKYDEADVVAGVLGHLPDGVRLQVQIAAARNKYAHARELLALFRTVRDGSMDEALAHAGLIAHLGHRPLVAAKLLLEFARLRPPGTSDLPLSLAVVLAHRDRKRDRGLYLQALQELRHPPVGLDDLVTWAIEQDVPEALNDATLPPLGRVHLERVAESLATDPERLLRFVRNHLKDRTTGGRDDTVTRDAHQYCAELLGRHGLVRDAFTHWRALAEQAPGLEERVRVLGGLRSFCDEVRFAEGYRYAAVTLLQLGVEVGEEAMDYADTLSSEEEPQSLPPGTEELVSQAATRQVPVLSEGLASAALKLKEEAGPRDAESLELLHTVWAGVATQLEHEDALSVLTGSATRDSVEKTRRIEADLRLQALLSENLISHRLREASSLLSDALNAAWEDVARDHLSRKSDGEGRLLELRLLRVTRLGSGPVEVKAEITALQSVSQITLGIEGAGPEGWVRLDRMEAGAKATRLLLLRGEHQEVKVTASGVLPQGPLPPTTVTQSVSNYPLDQRLSAHFKPSDRVDPAMFVGRTKELEDLARHYEKASRGHAGTLFMTGSRQAGKTSIAYQLSEVRTPGSHELPPPGKWRIPRVFPVYLNAEMTENSGCLLMTDIAQALVLAVDHAFEYRAPAIGMPEGNAPLDFVNWWVRVRRQLWPKETVGLLLVIDEFQHLLRRLRKSDNLDPVLTQLRGLKNERVGVGLLFCGAATTHGIRDLLEDTRFQQDFTTPYVIGPLDNDATRQAFHLGFLEPVQVMDEAAERVWELTQGHPQHIHMLGARVLKLLEKSQRTHVSAELVDVAFDWVVDQDDAVIGLLDPYGEGGREHVLSLLHEIARLIEEEPFVTAVRASLATAKVRDLDGLRDFGILVQREDDWAWVNPIVRKWLETRRPPHTERPSLGWEADPNLGWQMEEQPLRDEGYVVQRRFDERDRPKTCHLAHEEIRQPLVAQFHPGYGPQLERLYEIFSDSVQHVEGVPELLAPCGQWLVFHRVDGVSLQEKLEAKLAGGLVISPVEATRWIVDACDTLYRMMDARKLTHGDVRPENLVLHGADDSELYVRGWGAGLDVTHGKPLLPPGPSDYLPPEALKGTLAERSEADDAFALTAILYRLLHPSGALPYGDEESLQHGPELLMRHGDLGITIARGVSPRPGTRFRNAMELRNALSAAVPELRAGSGAQASGVALRPEEKRGGRATGDDGEALRNLLERLTDEIEHLGALTPEQDDDVRSDHEALAQTLEPTAPNPARVERFATRLRDTLKDLETASTAMDIVGEILDAVRS
ncbi:hypothetical protein [Streptomyces sp. 35G-GA-8]|uniref:hypothetical protein n=1 Tax=Streptomyces sp. 35G-GA-8 TaxID=2939434 RepID=UPI00201F3438|nr:hypothetical protein [Streptomyces sp. 35G-GA-8]MCL7378352.1 hypothetical protein [Streptomyces sp. 35G-GA-8]